MAMICHSSSCSHSLTRRVGMRAFRGHSRTHCHRAAVVASGGGKRLGLAAADSIPDRRLWADLSVLCRRRLPETVERDLIGAWPCALSEACPLVGRPQRLEAPQMIVIGVDVHKHSVSAVAVDEVGRQLDCLETSDNDELVVWSKRVGRRRLWALEDCRHVTRGLERTLQRERQRLVRVPPRLTAPERRRGRVRGKSDLIDALAIARAALREPLLDSPRPEEGRLRELKLLVDHRDDLVDERRRASSGCVGTCTSSTRRSSARSGRSTAPSGSNGSVANSARRQQTTQMRIARELLGRCRSLTRSILELDRELHAQTRRSRRGCSSCPAAAHSPPPSCSARSAPSTASAPTPNSPATPASHPSTPAQANTNATASTAAATANSTAPSTASPSPKAASTRPHAPTSNANRAKARADAKPSAASNDSSPAPSTPPSKASRY